MKLKKRYLALTFLVILFLTCQSKWLEFRTSAAVMEKRIMESSEKEPHFHQYEVNGRDIHYVHVGSDSLPLVLMVHGAPGSSDNMIGFLQDKNLTSLAQVVAVDRPGYGYSGFGEAERSVVQQAADLQPILEKHILQKDQKAILVGHSFGGPVIARMAMDCPDLIDGLVVVAGSLDPKLEPKKWYQKPLDWWCFRWMLPPAARVCNQEIIPLPEELEKMLPLWKNITCPVTLVHGTEDRLVPIGNVSFASQQLVNSKQVLVDSLREENHFILWSHQDRIVERIIELIVNE